MTRCRKWGVLASCLLAFVSCESFLIGNIGGNGSDLDAGTSPPTDGSAHNPDAGPTPPPPLAPCDFDADGLSDLVVFEHEPGMWHQALSSEVEVSTAQWGHNASEPIPGDYDGDGRVNRAVYETHNGSWHISSQVEGAESLSPVTVGPPGAFPAPADYDGDGMAELAVYDYLAQTWHERDFEDASSPSRQVQFGLPFAVPVPGDFDGDGRADRAVYQKRVQRWLVQRSGGGADLSFEFGSQYGLVVTGDYDGDGQDDAASFNPDTGSFRVRLSATGQPPDWSPLVMAEAAGGRPVRVDLDGDQTIDAALVLMGQSRLRVRLSSTGVVEWRDLPHDTGRFACPSGLDYRGGKAVVEVAAPELIRSSSTSRGLHVSLDHLEQAHLMTDMNSNAGLNLYSRIGESWQAIEPVIQKEDHGPMYPRLAIDDDGRGWFSGGVFRANDTDVTSAWVGMMTHMTTAPSLQWTYKIEGWPSFGGKLAIDRFHPGKAWHMQSWFPTWRLRQFDLSGYVDTTQLDNISRGSRTIDFAIAELDGGRAEGIRHVAHSVSWQAIRPGYYNSTMAASVVWNATLRSDGIDSDSTNAAIGLDETNPYVAFFSAFTDNLKMNIWNGSALVFGEVPYVVDASPASLGNAVSYFAPQWTHAAGGGAFICWTDSGNNIRLQHFDLEGNRTPDPAQVVTPGKQCDITTDFRGDVHLVYINDGLRYRVLHTR